jgi:small subunit ribosomal protein S4e
MYQKRSNIGKFWPIQRTGTKYLALAMHNKKNSIPIVVVLRDILQIVRNKKELKRAINERQILVNNKEIKETNYPISLFDVITFKKSNKSFKANLSKTKKMIFEEISKKESESKVYKVMDKKLLGNKKIQLNLSNGKNIISNEKISTGDSVIIDFKTNKIVKVLNLEKGKEVFVITGKHIGSVGKINNIAQVGNKKIAEVSSNNKKINVSIKNLMAIE